VGLLSSGAPEIAHPVAHALALLTTPGSDDADPAWAVALLGLHVLPPLVLLSQQLPPGPPRDAVRRCLSNLDALPAAREQRRALEAAAAAGGAGAEGDE
jgi:hypothetical protein